MDEGSARKKRPDNSLSPQRESGWRWGLASWRDGFFYDLQLNGPAPDRLRLAMPDAYQADEKMAARLIEGWIGTKADGLLMHGDISDIAHKWLSLSPDKAEHAHMHSFVWLRHLVPLGRDGELAATILIDAWLSLYSRYEAKSWAMDVTAERLLMLFRHAPPLLKQGDALWRSALLASMARQARHLAKSASRAETPRTRLLSAISLTAAGLLLPYHDQCTEQGVNLLRRELRLQIRQDGGHISRNPSLQLDIGLRLLGLMDVYRALERPIPGFISHNTGKIIALIEFFRCGDGRLAVFNGACEDDPHALRAALGAERLNRPQIDFASHTGYQKLTAARTQLLADLGGPTGGGGQMLQGVGGGQGNFSGGRKRGRANPELRPLLAHDGALSFQFSSGRHRIIVNCGAENPLRGTGLSRPALATPWQLALRQAPAHSTLTLLDAPPDKPVVVPSLYHRLFEDRRGQLLEMERLGVEHLAGATHRRRLFLDADGCDLRGEDVFIPASPGEPARQKTPAGFVLRFHLHPKIKASLSRDGRSVILVTPLKEGWRFQVDKGSLALEPSLYAGGAEGRQPTQQIIVRPLPREGHRGASQQLKWAIRKMKGRVQS